MSSQVKEFKFFLVYEKVRIHDHLPFTSDESVLDFFNMGNPL